jgi:hypothetical protein
MLKNQNRLEVDRSLTHINSNLKRIFGWQRLVTAPIEYVAVFVIFLHTARFLLQDSGNQYRVYLMCSAIPRKMRRKFKITY